MRTFRRRRRLLRATVALLLVVAGVAAFLLTRPGAPLGPPTCVSVAGGVGYQLTTSQAANAGTIAAVAVRMGLPDHAVTVALATALQESRLTDLTDGDRDSVGLFQQRPSQGWGTRAELVDPTYAATAFYRQLVRVPRWQTLPVTVAAQAVQHSADPSGYAQWAAEGRSWAMALTGEAPASLTCSFASPGGSRRDVLAAVSRAFGRGALGPPVAAKRGWAVASWLVAEADDYGIGSVSFDGRRWTNQSGRWQQTAARRDAVQLRLLRPG
jgi:hypothetical protein